MLMIKKTENSMDKRDMFDNELEVDRSSSQSGGESLIILVMMKDRR
jgi:hypothetical protein